MGCSNPGAWDRSSPLPDLVHWRWGLVRTPCQVVQTAVLSQLEVYGLDYPGCEAGFARSTCAGGALRRFCGSRPKTSDSSATTVAPHERGHDEHPHRQQKKAHHFDDRWYEALVGGHGSYPGGDSVVAPDLPGSGFTCIHRQLLSAKAGPEADLRVPLV
jgi:hypothetical protein